MRRCKSARSRSSRACSRFSHSCCCRCRDCRSASARAAFSSFSLRQASTLCGRVKQVRQMGALLGLRLPLTFARAPDALRPSAVALPPFLAFREGMEGGGGHCEHAVTTFTPPFQTPQNALLCLDAVELLEGSQHLPVQCNLLALPRQLEFPINIIAVSEVWGSPLLRSSRRRQTCAAGNRSGGRCTTCRGRETAALCTAAFPCAIVQKTGCGWSAFVAADKGGGGG